MRLICTKTLDLEEFFDINIPRYAILSHTWSDGEVSLQDWEDRKNRRFKPGYKKIANACALAVKDDLEYIWVDTNCIDKSSSAELSEAVNSMFTWYRRSHVCYAFLEDVPFASIRECSQAGSAFRESRWFTRGWTLQELIAPGEVKFYSQDWQELGSKVDLALPISETTGIAAWCLLRGKFTKSNPLRGYSVAQRLSWASRRATTRIEDQAYSLLGLFDITMPLVYGEGSEAFTRLLEAIIRKYADHSFLASQLRYADFLPRSPKEFCESRHVIVGNAPQIQKDYSSFHHAYPFQMTNTGLQISVPLVKTLLPEFVFGVLDCWDSDSSNTGSISRIWIPLKRAGPPGAWQFSRLLWPQEFFAVQLVPKETILQLKRPKDDGTDKTTNLHQTWDPSSIPSIDKFIDPVTTISNTSIVIKKPFASTISAPLWQPREAGSPFFLCFPRDPHSHRLYGIFPSGAHTDMELSKQKRPLLPIIIPRQIPKRNDDMLVDEDDPVLYGAVLVFKERRTSPARFVAFYVANVLKVVDNKPTYIPLCKIVRDWAPSKAHCIQASDFDGLGYSSVDASMLVTIQKLPCSSRGNTQGREPRFVGLIQIVFDGYEMVDELCKLTSAVIKEEAGLLQNYGEEVSDPEDVEQNGV